MTWDELKATFTSSIAATFFALLAECKANLDRILARLPNPPHTQAAAAHVARYADTNSLYDTLVLGISENVVQVPQVDVASAVVIVVGRWACPWLASPGRSPLGSTKPRFATRPPSSPRNWRPACRPASVARGASRRRRLCAWSCGRRRQEGWRVGVAVGHRSRRCRRLCRLRAREGMRRS